VPGFDGHAQRLLPQVRLPVHALQRLLSQELQRGHGAGRVQGGVRHAGIDFVKLDFGRKVFGQISPNFKFNQKRQTNVCRVARWFVFKPKIPIWVNFGGPKIGKNGYILQSFEIFY
jgi:hypothetical protein